MGIALMPHIPDNFILREIIDIMQRHRKFHRAQVRCQMTAGFTDAVNQKTPYIRCQLRKLIHRYFFYIIWMIDLFEHTHTPH